MTIGSAKQTKQEYAEKAFNLYNMTGSQFTIEEKLGISELPRVGKKEGQSKNGKGYSFEVVRIKISDGIFEKDLEMSEHEWTILCAALPKGLLSLQGVTLKVNRDQNLRMKIEYVGVAHQDMSGNSYNNGNHASIQAANTPSPTDQAGMIMKLHEAIIMTSKLGVKTDIATVTKMAESIKPGDAAGLIKACKDAGWICEHSDGIIRGT